MVKWFVISAFSLVLLLTFNNCDQALHLQSADLSSLSACSLILENEFAKGYQPFVKTNCISCHSSGGVGKGKFASSNFATAFSDFSSASESKVAQYAINPSHNPPFTGTQHEGEVSALRSDWSQALDKYNACLSTASVPEGEIPVEDTTPRIITAAINIGATETYKTITWDLSQALSNGVVYSGAEFKLDVKLFTSVTGETSYNFKRPRLKAGAVALHVEDVGVVINGNYWASGTTWKAVDKNVPIGQERDLSSGTMTIEMLTASSDTISISVKKLNETQFTPPTFTQLRSAQGVFGQACLSCHSTANPRGGLDLSNHAGLISQYVVVPFAPTSSLVYQRMKDVNNPMPPSGVLGDAQINQVRDWIADGALNN